MKKLKKLSIVADFQRLIGVSEVNKMDSIYKHHPDVRAAKEIAMNYHSLETFEHVARVAKYIKENQHIPKEYHLECVCLAYMHDLPEDTEYVNEPKFEIEFGRWSGWWFNIALTHITRKKDEHYSDYIRRIKDPSEEDLRIAPRYVYDCVWWVKLADIKDHLIQEDTLTDSLRDRYVCALSCLL